MSTTTAVQQEHEAIKRDLEHLGFKVELITAENWKQYKTEVLGKRPGAIYRTGWVADFPDPDNFLFPLFHSQSTNNYANYSNPAVDRLLEQARSEGDYLKRIELYRETENADHGGCSSSESDVSYIRNIVSAVRSGN